MLKKIIVFVFITFSWTDFVNADVAINETQLPLLYSGGANAVAMSDEWIALGAYDPNPPSNPNKTCYVQMYQVADYASSPEITWVTDTTVNKYILGGAKGNCNGNKGFGSAISLDGIRMVITSEENNGQVHLYEFDSLLDDPELAGW